MMFSIPVYQYHMRLRVSILLELTGLSVYHLKNISDINFIVERNQKQPAYYYCASHCISTMSVGFTIVSRHYLSIS